MSARPEATADQFARNRLIPPFPDVDAPVTEDISASLAGTEVLRLRQTRARVSR